MSKLSRRIALLFLCAFLTGGIGNLPKAFAQGKPNSTKSSPSKSKKPVVKQQTSSKKKNASQRNVTAGSSRKKKGITTAQSTQRPAGQTREIKLKKNELDKIRQDIKEFEKRLSDSKRREKNTLEQLDMYEKQTTLLRTLVNQLNLRIDDNRREITAVQRELDDARRSLDRLKKRYARSIVTLYKRGRSHDTELLLASVSLNQMLIRARYLKAFTLRNKKEVDEIKRRQDEISANMNLLASKLEHQEATMKEKKNEESNLAQKSNERRHLLNDIRQDKETYAAQLRRKQAAAAKIERIIADLVERERLKKLEARRKESRIADTDRSAGVSRLDRKVTSLPSKSVPVTGFGKLRGQLPWPVSHGAVIGKFGEQVNPRLGTVTVSHGIDIRVPSGSHVRSVADGVVSMINFIAGFGNLLIIDHDDGFYTVYAHLSSIHVRDGQRVKAGHVIAATGEGTGEEQLHFELWWERQKQNPLSWLAPK